MESTFRENEAEPQKICLNQNHIANKWQNQNLAHVYLLLKHILSAWNANYKNSVIRLCSILIFHYGELF